VMIPRFAQKDSPAVAQARYEAPELMTGVR
jgi:hypothetical protein